MEIREAQVRFLHDGQPVTLMTISEAKDVEWMENQVQLTSVEQLDECLAAATSQPLLLFKHSTSCPISAAAFSEMQDFQTSGEADKVKVATVHVIEDRPVSNEIAERLNIKHESPQAILLVGDEVKWHASHWKITKQSLTEAVQTL
ncbi:bacillithiol system redox-active protein YtxJ [Laceyella putida]